MFTSGISIKAQILRDSFGPRCQTVTGQGKISQTQGSNIVEKKARNLEALESNLVSLNKEIANQLVLLLKPQKNALGVYQYEVAYFCDKDLKLLYYNLLKSKLKLLKQQIFINSKNAV